MDCPKLGAIETASRKVWFLETVYSKFRKWNEEGVLEKVFKALSKDAKMENLSIDSTSIRVHQSANGGKLCK